MTISLAILVIVLVLSMTLLFSMQTFAKRQRQFAEPRQNARRALDYVAGYLRGATDGNFDGGNPNAIVVWYNVNAAPRQATYNNVANPNLAEPGTDIITFGRTMGGGRIIISSWNGPGGFSTASSLDFHFTDGCPNDNTNMRLFMDLTQCQNGDCSGNFPSTANSGVLMVVDDKGDYAYMVITGYQKSDCSVGNYQEIHCVANPGGAPGINPPGNKGVNCSQSFDPANPDANCKLGRGVTYMSLRILRDANGIPQLQQKNGIFDPTVDNPGTNFTPLLDNVEDLQIAYIYNDGEIRNDGINSLATDPSGVYTNGVPSQANMKGVPPPPRDITNVIGIRLSITALANTPVSFAERAKFFRPASEDRAEDTNRDRFYHYRLTSTMMLRNRNLGG